jgi:hypothetical protein
MSYLVDTNVISEVRRVRGDRRVKDWFSGLPADEIYLSVVTIGELRQGIEGLRRRDAGQAALLDAWLDGLKRIFADRVLKVSSGIAEEWGRLNVSNPLPPMDALLAATAKVRNMTLVTREDRALARTGVSLLNPWTDG